MKLGSTLKVSMVADWVAERPDGMMDSMPAGSNHWRCVLRCSGRRMTVYYSMGPALDGPPTADDVLESLLSDAMVDEDFGSFCRDMGYDEDSRKAERTHNACLRIKAKLGTLLGRDDFAEIWNAAND